MKRSDYKRGYAAGYKAACEAIGAKPRACANCGASFIAARGDARTCSPACRMALSRKKLTPRKRRRRDDATCAEYVARFPGFPGGIVTPVVFQAMRLAIRTGRDQPLLIEMRETAERNAAAYDARIAAEHAVPFTAELERHYTARIKGRDLIEGDCERPWQNYFAYRETHASDVEPLTDADLQYAGQWTTCTVRPRKSRRLSLTKPRA